MKTIIAVKRLLLYGILFYSSNLLAKPVFLLIHDIYSKPLTNALVKIDNLGINKITNNKGIVYFDLDNGEHLLDVEAGATQHFHYYIEISDAIEHPLSNPLVISMIKEPEHKIIIHANPLEHTALDMATPITIVSGEELINKRASTLGEILQFEPGLSFSSFGPAIARPVIRGLSGARVTITNNQMIVQDASTTSADHDVGVEPLLLEQIEVVKGPASLLYGSGAIGGVVNTIDSKIQSEPIDELTGGIEIRIGDSATSERSSVLTLNGGFEMWNWHIDGFSNESKDIKLPVSAESIALLNLDGEDTSSFNNKSILENSFSSTSGASVATTYLFDQGHIGLSISYLEKEYGLPGHQAHEEGHHDLELENHVEESVMIDMHQSVIHLQYEIENPIDGIDSLFVAYAYTDYQHQEIEGGAFGTEFINQAKEFKSYVKHQEYKGWDGIAGIQLIQRDFSAIGDEAFVPPSLTTSKALFWLEEKHFGQLKWELGLRIESQSILLDSGINRSENDLSYSIGSVYNIKKHNKIAFNFSHAVRFASAGEYFSYGPHLASGTFEIGNSNLKKETSDNWDFSYRFENKILTGEINLFHNQFSNYIFAELISDDDECLNTDAINQAQNDDLNLICYKQKDARFFGIELQIKAPLAKLGEHSFDIEIFADYLEAQLKDNEYLPRIPAGKQGLTLKHNYRLMSVDLTWVNYSPQNNLAKNELATSGFDILNLDLAYRVSNKSSEWYIFLKGKNLLNQEARDHASFIKDLAPRAGRSWLAGMRYTF